MLIFVAIISHTAADAGYVLVIPLGAVIFYAAGRHPLAGIAAAFAGVSGGFSANFIPSAIDPLLAGLTQEGAQIMAPDRLVNPLATGTSPRISSFLIILVGWYLTDKVVEPRLKGVGGRRRGGHPAMEPLGRRSGAGSELGRADRHAPRAPAARRRRHHPRRTRRCARRTARSRRRPRR
jgi:aminobenzoyl-glutamate transport protein